MKVSLKKAFSILDGRLATEMGDVYEMLNFIFDANFFTHQLPRAMEKLEKANPEWFKNGRNVINSIKEKYNTNDFNSLMKIIDHDYAEHQIELGKIKSF